jgi:hypothetical protein
MLDLRKLLLALALVALVSIPASAQQQLSCFAQAAGNPTIRAEGVAELVGDIIISCSGGTPALSTENLRQATI